MYIILIKFNAKFTSFLLLNKQLKILILDFLLLKFNLKYSVLFNSYFFSKI